jgi:predicted ArsR family transcriptional regulator
MQMSTRTVHRALLNCVEAGLLDGETVAALEGRPPQRYTLTDKGRWRYRELSREEPVAPGRETLLKAHKSDRHLAVILSHVKKQGCSS